MCDNKSLFVISLGDEQEGYGKITTKYWKLNMNKGDEVCKEVSKSDFNS